MNYAEHYRQPQVADGWLPIVEEMLVALKDLPITIVQIKEKFGELRVYGDYDDSVTDEQVTEIAETIEAAVYKARHTCEICGEPGKLVDINVLGVRCEAHV